MSNVQTTAIPTAAATAATNVSIVNKLDEIVAQAQAFDPMLEALITSFLPGVAIFLPEVKDTDYDYVRAIYATIGITEFTKFIE